MNITILNVAVCNNRTDSLLEYLEHEGYKYVTETVLHKPDIVRCKELLEQKLIEAERLASWNVEGSEKLDEHLRLIDAIKIVLKSIE